MAINWRRIEAKMNFGTKTRARVYMKLASFIKSGVALSTALDIMLNIATDDGKNKKDPMAYIYRDWLNKVNNGLPFGKAVGDWVPPEDKVILDAGDKSGTLDTSLERAVKVQYASNKIKNTIMVGLAQPTILFTMACFLMVIFGEKVIPAFAEAYPRDKWTGLPATLGVISDLIIGYMIPIVITVLSVIAVSIWSLPRWTGPLRAKFDKYPPWSIYRLNAGASFILSVSALIKSGVTVPDVLNTMMRSATPWFHERMSATLKHVNNGAGLGEALYKTGFLFPDPETVKDLRAFSKLDGFDERLEAIGNEMLESSVEKINMQMGFLRTASIIFIGIVFAIIVSGIFSLQQMITDAVSMPKGV